MDGVFPCATDHQLPVAAQWLGNPRTQWRFTAGEVNDQWWIFHQRLLMLQYVVLVPLASPPLCSPRNRKKKSGWSLPLIIFYHGDGHELYQRI